MFQDKFDAAFGNGFGPPEPDERYIYMYKHEHGIKCLKLKLQNEGFFLHLQCNSSFRDMLIERLQREIQFLKSEIERIKFEVNFFFLEFKMKS